MLSGGEVRGGRGERDYVLCNGGEGGGRKEFLGEKRGCRN